MRTTDVAVVGGGVIGCSIAYHLSKLGIGSTVFEQRRYGSGASGATAGVVGPLWHVSPSSEAAFALGLRSLEAFPGLATELLEAGIDPEFRQSGILKVALTEEQVELLRRNLVWQGELGLGVRWLEADEIVDREPEINLGVLGGVYSPNEGHVKGQSLVDSLVHAAGQGAATFLEGVEVIGLATDGRRVIGVDTPNETLHAGHTLLAAGAWTGIARRWVPEPVPVRPVKGQRVLLRLTGFLPRCPVHNFRGYVIPQPDGNILAGATRHEGEFDQQVTAEAIAQMIASATSTFPLLKDAVFVGARAGVRPGSPDDVPILGPVPGWKGLSVASGHDAVGIMLSPGTGQLMAQYISTGDSRPLDAFALSRFASPSIRDG